MNLGTLRADELAEFYWHTSLADGTKADFSATLEQADVVVHKDGSAMTLDAGTITVTNVVTGVQKVSIDPTNDADFTQGSVYWVFVAPNDETLDGKLVAGVLGRFRIESIDEQAARLFRQFLYANGATISTTTNNTTTALNMTDIADAQTTELAGEILALHKASNDVLSFARVTALTWPMATVETLTGSPLAAAVTSGDHVWRVGQYTAKGASLQALASQDSVDSIGDNTSTLLTDTATLKTQRSIPAKNSALTVPFKMVDATDFVTAETGLTVTAQMSQDGSVFGAAAGVVSEIGSGWYEMAATAADINANRVVLRFTAPGAAPTEILIITDGGV